MISESTPTLPFIPAGETVTGALSVGLFIVMWNYMGWELPAAAGDEIVNPKRTYPMAMVLVLFAAVATYTIPTFAGLYGGAEITGATRPGDRRVESGEGIGVALSEYEISGEQIAEWASTPPETSAGSSQTSPMKSAIRLPVKTARSLASLASLSRSLQSYP